MNRRILWIAGCVGAGLLGLLLLHFYNPTEYGFYPRCVLFSLTGVKCPGCGTLRALAALTHGDVVAAFKFNPLLIIALSLVPAFALYPKILRRAWFAWTAFWILTAYWIARNIW